MSYDMRIEGLACGTCGHQVLGNEFSITWNLSQMLEATLDASGYPKPVDDRYSWPRLSGLMVHQLRPILAAALEELEKKPYQYRQLNPPNGFGIYEDLKTHISALLEECDLFGPTAQLRVW